MAYEHELQTAIRLARKASKSILPFYYGTHTVEIKEDGTPVTNADLLANQIIQDGLQKAFPLDGIVSEELKTITGGRTWYVDPIDGTKGFDGHSDQFAIHIGLAEDESPVLGIVYKPTTTEHYIATKGGGAFRVHPDGSTRQFRVPSNRPGLRIVVNSSFFLEEPNLLKQLSPDKVLISGGLGLRVMRVVEGKADAFIKSRRNSGGTWDTCAPQAIIEQAGGFVQYTDGRPITYHGQRQLDGRLVMARSRDVADELSEAIEAYAIG